MKVSFVIHLLNRNLANKVRSGIFGQTAKFEQRPCSFHISNIGIKNRLTNSKNPDETVHK